MEMKGMEVVERLVADVKLPKMFPVRQKFDREHLNREEIPSVIRTQLSRERFAGKIHPGMKIAVTAGSRGISSIPLIIKTITDFIKEKGGEPFIVPAMGSHGKATAEGQKEVLTGYGITEEYLGCPIRSSMEVKKIGQDERGRDVYIDRLAAEADGIIVCNRIKPHTAFRGPYESGIMKMMTIGLGKQHGAEVCHGEGPEHMAENIPAYGKAILKHAPVLFALAILENAFDETRKIVALEPEEIEGQEPLLLKEAFAHMPKILVDKCDVLAVRQIGKDLSGDGMDPNITGTFCTKCVSGGIDARRICVLDLSLGSHGNFMGLGFADAATRKAFHKLDLAATYPNAITCLSPPSARIPMIMGCDRSAIQLCLKTCAGTDRKNSRIVMIQDTLHLEHIWLSEAYWKEIADRSDMVPEGIPEELPLDSYGNIQF